MSALEKLIGFLGRHFGPPRLFLLVAGINAMLFETSFSDRLMALEPDADMPLSAKVVGAVSLISWFAVLYFGRMLPYLDPNPQSGV